MGIESMTRHDILITIMSMAAFLIAFILYLSKKKTRNKKPDFLDVSIQRQNKEEVLYQKLVNMVFGDKKAAERLISMEQGRTPHEPKMKLIQSAIERLQSDRR